MAAPPAPADGDESFFDSAHPFKGVVVCCTSVPTELRADIAAKTIELGGQHKYDLTPDCTHLIVGDYDTPKYRHVAKERPDVRVMSAGWVEAVRNLWVEDADIDFLALEKEWQLLTFESGGGELTPDASEPQRRRLLCCMTGFEDPDERQQIIDMIEANGGLYTGDLTKRVTHLIVHKPEGRKYQAAKAWGVVTVSVEWVTDSVERGLMLDEKLYDPVLPQLERGVSAWNKQKSRVSSLGKRLRDNTVAQEEGSKRKLRKTASMKLNNQRDNLWGDILGKPQPSELVSPAVPEQVAPQPAAVPPPRITQPTQPAPHKSLDTQGSKLSSVGVPDDSAVFASCCFYVHGFSAQKTEILANTVASLGGLICHSPDEVVSTSGAQLAHRFLIVPQTAPPETHPQLPDNVHIITEFYIERCLHKKYFFDPSQHVIGRPFPLFPIPGFEDLSICTAGFTGVDLNQLDKSIRQLGAKYEERFTANVSLLVCSSLSSVRKQKLELAVAWKVPVVSADWLWECISTGFKAPIKRFLFPELKQNLDSPKVLTQAKEKGKAKPLAKGKQVRPSSRDDIDQDLLPKPATKPRQRRHLYESAFVTAKEDMEETAQRRKGIATAEHDSNLTTTTHFETALTHAHTTNDANVSFGNKTLPSGGFLSETSSNSLNKTPTSPRQPSPTAPRKPMSRITSVADSEATDGAIDQPDDGDIPVQENEENAEKPTTGEAEADHPNPETEKKRLNAEKAAAAEQERLAISTKLVTSLLDSTSAKLGMASTTATTATAAFALATTTTTAPTTTLLAAGGPAKAALSEDSAPPSAAEPGSALGTAAAAAAAAAAKPPPPMPKRRKRNILGRAISNVSAASSTSESSAPSAAAATNGVIVAGRGSDSVAGGGGGDGGPPPATQLEYEDPEARRYKEQLMSKMLGTAESKTRRQQQEKLTLTEMGGYADDLLQRFDPVAGGGYGGGRKTRRR